VNYNTNIQNRFAELASQAKYNMDCHFFQINFSRISNALMDAANRGVKIRIITDSDYYNSVCSNLDAHSNIIVINDEKTNIYKSGSSESHNKFAIFDYYYSGDSPVKYKVWTGSFNFGSGVSGYEGIDNPHEENVIIISNQKLAEAFTREFCQMWGDTNSENYTFEYNSGESKFHNSKVDVISSYNLHVINDGDTTIEVYFNPQNMLKDKIIEAINSANYRIHFAINMFTYDEIKTALINKHNEGVLVAGIIDQSQSSNMLSQLQEKIGEDYIRPAGKLYKMLHDKYIIIDPGYSLSDPIVITGSANWTPAGIGGNTSGKNDENIVIIHNLAVSLTYYDDFYSRYLRYGGKELPAVFSPPEFQKFYAQKVNSFIKLFWELPGIDLELQALIKNIAIYYSTSSFPSSPSEGTLLTNFSITNYSAQKEGSYEHKNVYPNTRYYYSAFLYSVGGSYSVSRDSIVIFQPSSEGSLADNYIRPEDYSTVELYFDNQLPSEVKVYSADGSLVKKIVPEREDKIEWDLTNEKGKKVSSGLYIIVYEIDGKKEYKKVFVVR